MKHKVKKYAIIVAGGSGSRMGSETPKQFLKIAGLPILLHTLLRFFTTDKSIELIVVLPEEQIPTWEKMSKAFPCEVPHQITAGGASRTESVKNGLILIEGDGLVAVHDGVRPFATDKLINDCYHMAKDMGTAIAAVPLKDSIRKVDGRSTKAENRDDYFLIQTPQTFNVSILKDAYEKAGDTTFSDDATAVEAAGYPIHLAEGSYTNIKITTPEDLVVAEAIQKGF